MQIMLSVLRSQENVQRKDYLLICLRTAGDMNNDAIKITIKQ